ncbi:MAG: hypothetical protein WD766_14765 [Gemmatimonadota bacterium]
MTRHLLLAALLLAVAGCAPPPTPMPAPRFIGAPNPEDVESVIFLIGDAGEAPYRASPVIARMTEDIERWSQTLEGDTAVAVLFLGDIVYPLGMHPPGSPEYPADSLMVLGQVETVAGPAARESAHGIFMAGNHDWGLEEEWEGFQRLQDLGVFLAAASEWTGASVRLAPDAGTGGPYVLDLGRFMRVIVLDTAWWILDGGQLGLDGRDETIAGIRDAIAGAGDREVLIAAHHPFHSAGPHGGQFSFWRTLGVRYLMVRSGAMLQDLTSIPYRELSDGLRSVFADMEPPLVFAGGHEHSLQVFDKVLPNDPDVSIVSGSGSKLSSLGTGEGILFGRSEPGYMKIFIEKDGGMGLFVESAPEQYLKCPTAEPQRSTCMAEGVAAFETAYSQRLRGP